MKDKYYILLEDTKEFKQGQIVRSFWSGDYRTKISNNKIIDYWKCCRCPIYKTEIVDTIKLQFLDEF